LPAFRDRVLDALRKECAERHGMELAPHNYFEEVKIFEFVQRIEDDRWNSCHIPEISLSDVSWSYIKSRRYGKGYI